MPKKALGANNYIDEVQFFFDEATNAYAVSFHTKTTFSANCSWSGFLDKFLLDNYYQGDYYPYWDTDACNLWISPNLTGGNFIAGITYKISGRLIGFQVPYYYTLPLNKGSVSDSHWLGRYLISSDYLTLRAGHFFPSGDDVIVYLTEFPNLTITYPLNNDEIAGFFNITGSYTIPSGAGYNALIAFFYPPSWSNEGDYLNAFYQELSTTTGSVLMPVYSLALGNYQIVFRFYGQTYEPPATLRYEVPAKINISILQDIPPAFFNEPTSTPPIIPQYLEPDIYYPSHSNYPSSTPLYNSLTSALNPLLAMVSNNLTAFNDRFSLSNASSSGYQFGGAILTIRGYADNLNSLFGNAPISQAFTLYIILFLAVIIFRLIRGLINLIKL